jgi:multisubunit Na+/H+ antiporter MnhC subunit
VDRLTELKAVKAESSALSSGNENDGLQQEKQSASTERDYGVTRHGIILSCSLVVYTMIRILPLSKTMTQTFAYQTFIDMCSILLQTSSLRSLLYILSLLVFDAIKFGRSDAFIKGRELYISQVSKFTYLVSVAIVLTSLVIVVATMFFQKVACFMIRGESGVEMQSPQLLDRTANLESGDASMGTVLDYLMRNATIVIEFALASVDRLLPPLLGLNNFFASVCEESLSMPSSLTSHLVHQTLSVCTYFTTRFAVFCVAAFGIAQVLLPKSR